MVPLVLNDDRLLISGPKRASEFLTGSEVSPDEVARLLEVWPEDKARGTGGHVPWTIHIWVCLFVWEYPHCWWF